MKKIISVIAIIILAIILIFVFGKNKDREPVANQEKPGVLLGSIDFDNSSVEYIGYGVGKEHVGIIPIKNESTVIIDTDGMITGGTVIFDMTGITSDTLGLTSHLKSPDFFDVEQFPTASYTITNTVATPLDPSNDIIINGDLTIAGQTHAHNVAATYDVETGQLSFTTGIDRTKWGVEFNSSKIGEFGDSLIEDKVGLEVVIDID